MKHEFYLRPESSAFEFDCTGEFCETSPIGTEDITGSGLFDPRWDNFN